MRGRRWTGGYNYLLNLLRAIDSFAAHRIAPLLIAGNDATDEEIQPFRQLRCVQILQSADFDLDKSRRRVVGAAIFGKDNAAARTFDRYRIDVVFEHAIFHGWRLSIPAIAWFPDFQHRYMSNLFSVSSYWKRDLGFRAQVLSGRTIMLSSEDARRDCEKFYPSSKGRTSVVRFAITVDADQLALNPIEVARTYNLPERFFYLPNQFWKHKNHRIVIEALHLLKQRRREVVVASSGEPTDPRDPGYYEELRSIVVSLGLTNNFRFLGMVPRTHVMALMRASVAVINPSLFEGWSTTVEEAKTIGAPVLLSNLSVHREQAGEGVNADFFDPSSFRQLADLLDKRAQQMSSTPRPSSLPRESEDRVRKFASEFSETVERAAHGLVSV